ncbi:methyl-accepting chemotaxis protein [Arcobacter sp.]|uniref:methyl-accepting chemotaxis protein n=1 Tax=unclassified Arcobacter TaxID=2593671 RepID=UPI003B00B276|eukprot:TRINITY_DN1673_c0_g1_i3.p1 TRINITY_DN1673_c0_g1~~TRINITY_DN1673_c0_g1_i3.p1  ORF type:complete len:729 (-),score=-62.15 TRINITY_DN1673_c0_g1_i3:69-2255(-)
MFGFISKKISNKIIFALIILMAISSTSVIYFTTTEVKRDSLNTTKEYLEMLNTAMFQSLRNAMSTGDVATIQKAEKDAATIKGVKNLTVAKSKPLIEMYAPNAKYTEDLNILKSFETKNSQLFETTDNGNHEIRMIKPMIAEQDCIMCHANQQVGDVIGVMDLTFSLQDSDRELVDLVVSISTTSLILSILTIVLIFFLVKRATNPIESLKSGFTNLIESNDTNIRLSVQSKDEISEVADLFNSYMDKVNAGLALDAKVIEEANDVLEKTGNGFFVYNVNSKAANPHVEDLKNKLNTMISGTRATLEKINATLKHYSESKFDAQIDDKGIYGDLGSLTAGIKLVGHNTSEILAMIMNTGDSLNENTQTLSDAASNLSKSSNKQAASLEETAAALEEITSNIKGTNEAASKMKLLSQELTASAKNGQDLANQTANSMEDINKQVSSINDAIEIIDQIAFQTNILSLNAAVEAATAGEAGKGFAVVAQEVRNLASRSAEAAKEIKDIVEAASMKAKGGQDISNKMIEGYNELNQNVTDTIVMIDNVSNAAKEQEAGIRQINDAVTTLDQATQQNAGVAEDISNMSRLIANMSNSLVTAASRASFIQDAREQVCNVDLVYDAAKVKVNVLELKDQAYSRLGEKTKWSATPSEVLSTFISNFEATYNIEASNSLEELKTLNSSLARKIQALTDANANNEANNVLNEKAKEIEIESLRIFGTLNTLKKEVCNK